MNRHFSFSKLGKGMVFFFPLLLLTEKKMPVRRFSICLIARFTLHVFTYVDWILLTVSLLSDTHNSVRFGKQSRFSSSAICCPISVRLWRFGKYSMPIILGNPEKNISNLVTFIPDPFCSLSNFTPFIVHWQKNNENANKI